MSADFHNLYSHDFLRVGAAVARVEVGDPAHNLAATLDLARQADADRLGLVAFPELGLSAYAIDDLFLQDALLARVETEIAGLAKASEKLAPVLIVGALLEGRPSGHVNPKRPRGGFVPVSRVRPSTRSFRTQRARSSNCHRNQSASKPFPDWRHSLHHDP